MFERINILSKDRRKYEKFFIIVMIISFVLFITSIIVLGFRSSQLNLFFMRGNDFFADTLNGIAYSSRRDPYNNTYRTGLEEKAYPPLSYIYFYALSRLVDMNKFLKRMDFWNLILEPKILYVLCLFVLLFFVSLFWMILTYKKGPRIIKITMAISVLISSPVLFTLERGNIILFAAICLIFYVFNYNSEKPILRELAYVSLAIAAALKITPAVFGILLLYEKRWKDAIKTIFMVYYFCFCHFCFLKEDSPTFG